MAFCPASASGSVAMASHMAFAAATAADASFFTGGRPGGGRGFSFPTL